MRLRELEDYLEDLLPLKEVAQVDQSLNGVQVACSDKELSTVAFAVDACMATFERAAEGAADALFVHHGLFWGKPLAVRGSQYERMKFLLSHDLALLAAHLPLDLHPQLGNNAGIAAALKLEAIEPFGYYRGLKIGCKGMLPRPSSLEEVLLGMGTDRRSCVAVLPFGPEEIRSVGIVSGGGTSEVEQAIREGLDLYITGDASHQVYHTCMEEKINMISGGHYQTEVWGVRLLARRLAQDLGLRTFFVDVPTGL